MPRGSKAAKEAKRRTVAKGIVAGKSTAQIAKDAACNTRHVERLAAEPETQLLITDLMKPHRAKLECLVEKAIAAVDSALVAKRTDKADHMARLRAVGRTRDLVTMAAGKPHEETDAGGGLVTWEEFVVLYRKKTQGQPCPSSV
jgi:hypothetical protein